MDKLRYFFLYCAALFEADANEAVGVTDLLSTGKNRKSLRKKGSVFSYNWMKRAAFIVAFKIKQGFLDKLRYFLLYCAALFEADANEAVGVTDLLSTGKNRKSLKKKGSVFSYNWRKRAAFIAAYKIKQGFLEKGGFELTFMGANIFHGIEIYFRRLENEMLEDCLLYFAAYSINSISRTDQLIRYWMGEGFLSGEVSCTKRSNR